ncbi:MAG: ATP-binding cassette domain-containing protein, partial [Pseudomonadales bacterium]|nr:ATP-binding cassette domain-containing protein [Pseudomonadales bacterium]
MLSFTNLTLRRGTAVLFSDVSLTLHQGQKAGLVGANGAGKTSLFRLICGELEADTGDLSFPASTRIAWLQQEIPATPQPAIEYVLDGDTALRRIEAAISTAEQDENYSAIGQLHEQLDSIDGYSARSRAGQLLAGLGFTNDQFELPLSAFSGGWRIRLNLAQTLMTPSDLLLLDEPT